MGTRNLIVIGASAGGIEVLRQLVSDLPPDFPAAIAVVVHIPADAPGALPRILDRAGPLPASFAEEGAELIPGQIVVAPPDHHVLIRDGVVHLSRGPRENGHRPAVDTLFRSAAIAAGARVIGVVLSGALDDGTAGLRAIKRRGGLVLVQDPADALYEGMPSSALAHVEADAIAASEDLAGALVRLLDDPVTSDESPVPDAMRFEDAIMEVNMDVMHGDDRPGQPSPLSCPDCSGVLWEIRDGTLVRYRCRVGHAWAGDSLLAEQNMALESALWTAMRALEEKASLCRQMAAHSRGRAHGTSERHFTDRATEAEAGAETIRVILVGNEPAAVG